MGDKCFSIQDELRTHNLTQMVQIVFFSLISEGLCHKSLQIPQNHQDFWYKRIKFQWKAWDEPSQRPSVDTDQTPITSRLRVCVLCCLLERRTPGQMEGCRSALVWCRWRAAAGCPGNGPFPSSLTHWRWWRTTWRPGTCAWKQPRLH